MDRSSKRKLADLPGSSIPFYQFDAPVIMFEDFVITAALAGHCHGAGLAKPHTMAPSPSGHHDFRGKSVWTAEKLEFIDMVAAQAQGKPEIIPVEDPLPLFRQ